jgi:hypothetical protein
VRKLWKLTTVTGAAVVLATMVSAGQAVAVTKAPSGYGFDNQPDVIVGGGSDTTAKLMIELGSLYETSEINNGCAHVTPPSGSDTEQNQCDGSTDRPFNDTNWDGDTVGEANPTGSGAGRQALLDGGGTGNYHGTINKISNPARTDAATATNGSAIVNDASITAADAGKMVTGTGIPDPAFVEGVVAGVSFHISASANSFNGALPVDAPYTGVTGAVSIKISTYGDMTAAQSPGPVPDFGRSSSTASTNGCNPELNCSTFWGYANDQVQVIAFGNHGATLNHLVATGELSPTQLAKIWSCNGGPGGTRTRWEDIDPVAFPGDTAFVTPWTMNSSSGTYNTFKAFIGVDPDTAGTCSIGLGGTHAGTAPLENDVKPWFQSTQSLAGFGTGDLNPENWIGWGSFGVFSAFPYTSQFTTSATATVPNTFYQGVAAAVAKDGLSAPQLPSTDLASQYPITRVLWHVTRKGDADCPAKLTGVTRSCDFANNGGPFAFGAGSGARDLNVTGPTWDGLLTGNLPTNPTGPGGAIREFTRWLCRASSATQGTDPYQGVNDALLMTGIIGQNGFSVVPTGLRSSGSRCDVQT